jgi:hypothetical protein
MNHSILSLRRSESVITNGCELQANMFLIWRETKNSRFYRDSQRYFYKGCDLKKAFFRRIRYNFDLKIWSRTTWIYRLRGFFPKRTVSKEETDFNRYRGAFTALGKWKIWNVVKENHLTVFVYPFCLDNVKVISNYGFVRFFCISSMHRFEAT